MDLPRQIEMMGKFPEVLATYEFLCGVYGRGEVLIQSPFSGVCYFVFIVCPDKPGADARAGYSMITFRFLSDNVDFYSQHYSVIGASFKLHDPGWLEHLRFRMGLGVVRSEFLCSKLLGFCDGEPCYCMRRSSGHSCLCGVHCEG